ncbi:MAG: peptidoglycan editing factor PgeF [Gammaproteobacteria bacterium]
MSEGAVSWLRPVWAAPANVHAAATTRVGGVSRGSWASLNLAMHVGDDPALVADNRRRLAAAAKLPTEPRWLHQVHGKRVVRFDAAGTEETPTADAAVTCAAGVVLAVLTADCLPVLLAACDGSAVGVVHVGWRGLGAGVIEAALAAMPASPGRVSAWLGPAIGAAHYEVGEEVREAFAGSPGSEDAFRASARTDHWYCNLVTLVRARLAAAGVREMAGGEWDTLAEPERFYSYRRDGKTGRMASLIWI